MALCAKQVNAHRSHRQQAVRQGLHEQAVLPLAAQGQPKCRYVREHHGNAGSNREWLEAQLALQHHRERPQPNPSELNSDGRCDDHGDHGRVAGRQQDRREQDGQRQATSPHQQAEHEQCAQRFAIDRAMMGKGVVQPRLADQIEQGDEEHRQRELAIDRRRQQADQGDVGDEAEAYCEVRTDNAPKPAAHGAVGQRLCGLRSGCC